MKAEAKTGIMLPQAKELLRPPEAGRREEYFFPSAFRGSMACHLNFELLASRTVKEQISAI